MTGYSAAMAADGVSNLVPSAFLGVERSLSGRAWRERAADPLVVRDIQQRHGLIEPLARALAARGPVIRRRAHR